MTDWLASAGVTGAVGIGFAAASVFYFTAPQTLRPYATPVAYAVTTALILARGRASFAPALLGSWSIARSVLFGIACAAAAITVQAVFPYRCVGDCTPIALGTLSPLTLAIVGVLAPLCETFVIQGSIQTHASEMFGRRSGAVVACALFVAIHLSVWPMLLVIAPLLTWLRARSDGLLAPIVAHATVNLAVSILTALSAR